jgi:putative transposase
VRLGSYPGTVVARFKVPDGWAVQAFTFALDCTQEQAACVRRQFGGRRYARNWAVRTLKDDIARYRESGQETEKPSLASLRMRWNRAKDAECTDAETGQAWWPEISKEAFADGIRDGTIAAQDADGVLSVDPERNRKRLRRGATDNRASGKAGFL